MKYEDKEMTCQWQGCKEKFIWTAGDQEYYAERGFTPPKYCRTHRAERKRIHEERERKEASPFNPKNFVRGRNDKKEFSY
jgi:hypothetical protein